MDIESIVKRVPQTLDARTIHYSRDHDDSKPFPYEVVFTMEQWERVQDAIQSLESYATSQREQLKDGTCSICQQPTQRMHGNPALWPIWFEYRGGNGKMQCYCRGCIVTAVAGLTEQREMRKGLEKLRDDMRDHASHWAPFERFVVRLSAILEGKG